MKRVSLYQIFSFAALTVIVYAASSGGDGHSADTKKEKFDPKGDVNAKGGWTYDYKQNGEDWPQLISSTNAKNYCGSTLNQSPVNLLDKIGSYGWAYGSAVPKEHDGPLEVKYSDLRKKKKIAWKNKVTEIGFEKIEGAENYFKSNLGMSLFNSATNQYNADKMMLRSPSEHMVMGQFYDIELQIKHNAKKWNSTENIKYAYISIFFSVEEYDKSINFAQNETVRDFFKDLKFDDHGEPEVDEIRFGKLMNLLNFEERWVYLGSETFPPCEQYVYWNVVQQVLPIEIQTFAKFKAIMAKKEGDMGNKGNNRHIQPINDHQIAYVGAMIGQTISLYVLSVLTYIIYSY